MKFFKKIFTENILENYFKKYKLTFMYSFSLGVLISAIPYIFETMEDLKIKKLIKEEKRRELELKEKICKNKDSEYLKFIKLGFPDTAILKFNICMKEQ